MVISKMEEDAKPQVAVVVGTYEDWREFVREEVEGALFTAAASPIHEINKRKLHTEDCVFHMVVLRHPARIRGYRFDSYIDRCYWETRTDEEHQTMALLEMCIRD